MQYGTFFSTLNKGIILELLSLHDLTVVLNWDVWGVFYGEKKLSFASLIKLEQNSRP